MNLSKIGKLGEDLCIRYYENKGYKCFLRNYLKKCGEIDCIFKEKETFIFVEVKTLSRENISDVSYENTYLPEYNIDQFKLDKLRRIIEVFIAEYKVSKWRFDVCLVEVGIKDKKAKIRVLEDEII